MPISNIRTVAEWLRSAERIVTLSGAGLSKASGIPTYRDAGGLWKQGNNLAFSQADALTTNPDGFRAFWAARRADLANARPNRAHAALTTLQTLKPQLVCVTQNIDGLLTAAGCANVLELHGSMARSRCVSCALDLRSEQSECPSCHALTRPDVVLFGEELPRRILAEAEWAAKNSELCLVIGTSGVVYPAAGLANKAKSRGARLVVINLEPTAVDSDADAVLLGPAEGILPELVSLVEEG
jgi:NAD-dependent deacetylase